MPEASGVSLARACVAAPECGCTRLLIAAPTPVWWPCAGCEPGMVAAVPVTAGAAWCFTTFRVSKPTQPARAHEEAVSRAPSRWQPR